MTTRPLRLVRFATGRPLGSRSAHMPAGGPIAGSRVLARVALLASAVLAASTAAAHAQVPTDADFGRHAAEAYRGPTRAPDFGGRDRAHATYRTRIREGIKDGPNFAGHLALVVIGCGSACRFVRVVDTRTGRVSAFPLGGEDYSALDLTYRSDSRLVSARWVARERCRREDLVWTGTAFRRGTMQDLGEPEICYQLEE